MLWHGGRDGRGRAKPRRIPNRRVVGRNPWGQRELRRRVSVSWEARRCLRAGSGHVGLNQSPDRGPRSTSQRHGSGRRGLCAQQERMALVRQRLQRHATASYADLHPLTELRRLKIVCLPCIRLLMPVLVVAALSCGSAPAAQRLQIQGTRFVAPDGRDFRWRGITAFRLVDYVADGQEELAARYLEWAGRQGLTVVRVLTMMAGQFDLRPADGRRALPRVLELAAKNGLHVEVVALAGTADIPVNLQEHLGEIGKILAAHPNGVLEIANEPVHPSQ